MKSQVWCAVSYDSKFLYIHANRRRKKRKGPTINPEYRLELKGLNARELGYVVEKEFGDGLQAAGVEIFIVDNDRKAHSNTVRDEWAKFGIKVWPGAGIVGDRCLISEFTGEDESELGSFPVNSPDFLETSFWWTLQHLSETQALRANYWWLYQRHRVHVGKFESAKDSKCN